MKLTEHDIQTLNNDNIRFNNKISYFKISSSNQQLLIQCNGKVSGDFGLLWSSTESLITIVSLLQMQVLQRVKVPNYYKFSFIDFMMAETPAQGVE